MSTAINLCKKTFFVITGASKGIGKTMAIECSRKFESGSVVVLLARSEIGLQATQAEILQANPSINVHWYSIDLCRPPVDQFKKCLNDSLASKKTNEFDSAFIIHNVGSLGNLTKNVRDLNDPVEWRDYLDLNVSSVAVLNSLFMNMFIDIKKIVVNISSSAAIKPFESMGLYCTGKAARQMLFNVLAHEEPDTIVLNYSPGPVDTDMQTDIIENSACTELQDRFKELRRKNESVTTQQTTEKFLKVIENGLFKSGDYIYYYDC